MSRQKWDRKGKLMDGIVYILEFDHAIGDPDRPGAFAKYYVGWSEKAKFLERIEAHSRGEGAKITRALHDRGIGFRVVYTATGTRDNEIRIKNYHGGIKCFLEAQKRREESIIVRSENITFPPDTAVKVIFRKWRGGDREVIALFPEIPGDVGGYYCLSYSHHGQHGSANIPVVNRLTVPAKPKEYVPLLQELTRIGYDLVVYHRITPKMHDNRHIEHMRWLTSGGSNG